MHDIELTDSAHTDAAVGSARSRSQSSQPMRLLSLIKQPQATWAAVLTIVLAVMLLVPDATLFAMPASYVPWHTILELPSIAVSIMVAALAWNVRSGRYNNRLTVLGAGFLGVAIIDAIHTVSYPGMPDFITPNSSNKSVYFWLCARYIAALSILAAGFLRHRHWEQRLCLNIYGVTLALIILIAVVGLFHLEALPVMHIPGVGLSPFKIMAEYFIAATYMLAAIILIAKNDDTNNADQLWLACAAWTFGLSDLLFTRYINITDLSNTLGHLYKVCACAMAYRAIFVAGVQAPQRNLARQHSWLQSLLAAIPDPVWLKTTAGVYVSCNSAFEKLFGARNELIAGKSDYDLFPKPEADSFRMFDQLTLRQGGTHVNEEHITLANGQRRFFETTKTTPRLPDGSILGVLGIARDITEQKIAEDELRLAAKTFESQEGILITDANRVILRVNNAFSKITGYSAAEAIGKTPQILKSGRHDQAFYTAMNDALAATDTWAGEVWNRRKNGDIYPQWLTITVVRNDAGLLTHYIANLIDITERKAANDRITYLSFYDSLTQLPNRRLLLERLGQAIRKNHHSEKGCALLLIDIDNFKMLNETRGHDAGDRLLAAVADRLTSAVKNSDTIARIGGDEFAIILEDLPSRANAAEQAELHAQKILNLLTVPYHLSAAAFGEQHFQCSSSIGIALCEENVDSADEFFRRANTAISHAKINGRNSISLFDPAMLKEVEERAALEADLRRAIAEEQLLLHYQPQVDAAGQIIGAEALLRWRHPERGMVSPGAFIPLAEETGLIVPIGHGVLKTACDQLARWSKIDALSALTLAVNISERQFSQADFVEHVCKTIERSGAAASRLKLELTESLLARNTDDIIAKMLTLKARGVRFSLDDFGTGYSSLSYLKRLPLHQLKIDQSFVREVVTDENDAAIAKTIIGLGKTLGMTVIAEGVETEAQRNFLLNNGCQLFQGYLFGRPLPLDEFEAMLAHQRAQRH